MTGAQHVLAILSSCVTSTLQELIDTAPVGREAVRAAIAVLIQDGKIERTKPGIYRKAVKAPYVHPASNYRSSIRPPTLAQKMGGR